MKYAAGFLTSFGSSPLPTRSCVRPSCTVRPCGVSLRESADVSKFFRPSALLSCLPDGFAFDHLHGFHAGFAAFATLDHALHRFQRVIVHRVRPALADHQRVFDLASERKFQVRAAARLREEKSLPASGNFKRFDASTILFAFSKLQDRCLSL